MLNRKIKVIKADGSLGDPGVEVNNMNSHEYFTPVPKNESQANAIRSKISEDFDEEDKLVMPAKTKSESYSSSFSVIKFGWGKTDKELVYREREAKEFKLYSDGTWDYNRVSSQDTNSKYVIEE